MPKSLEDLQVGDDKARRLEIIPSKAVAAAVAAAESSAQRKRKHEESTEGNLNESDARRLSARQQQTALQTQNNQPSATGNQLFSFWLNQWNNQQVDSLAQHIQAWHADGWEYRCKQLLRYKLEHNGDVNNINIHYKAPDDMTLGQWVHQQRTLYREGRLPPERIQHLRGMGFNFDHVPPSGESFTGDEYFDSRLRELIAQHKALMIATSRAVNSSHTPAVNSFASTPQQNVINQMQRAIALQANQSGQPSQSNHTPAALPAAVNESSNSTNDESTEIRRDGTTAQVELTPLDESDERVHYPDGNVTLIIKKPEVMTKVLSGGKVHKIWPTTSWAYDSNMRSIKRRCMGMWICSVQGCSTTERPCAPRSGTGKYNNKGKLPRPRITTCQLHGDTLTYIKCDCYWYIRDKDERHWKLQHFGTHDHPKPKERKDARRKKLKSTPKKGATNVTSDDDDKNDNGSSPSKPEGDREEGVVV